MVRVALLAAMLGLGVWGYMEFNDPNAPALVAEEQTQQIADSGMTPEGGYTVTPTPDTAATPAPATAAPQAASASEPVPPPSTTIGDDAGR